MKSSWSINDFPAEEGDDVYLVEERYKSPPRDKPRRLTFEEIRNRPNRKGRGSRMRNGEKKWATCGH